MTTRFGMRGLLILFVGFTFGLQDDIGDLPWTLHTPIEGSINGIVHPWETGFQIQNDGVGQANDNVQGRDYKFAYSGVISTGVPEIGEQYAGYSFHCYVFLQAITSSELKLRLENVTLARFNKKMSDAMDLEPIDYESFNSEALTMPIKLTMLNSQIDEIWMSSHETHWTSRIKLTIVDLIKTQFALHNHASQANLLINQLKVVEDEVDGKCENVYSMMELPRDADTSSIMEQDICRGKTLFHIQKVRDLSRCEKSNKYVSRRGMEKVNRAATSRFKFVGCGDDSSNILIFSGTHEGSLIQKMFNSESTVTGIKQQLRLVEIRNTTKDLGEILDIKNVTFFALQPLLKSNNVAQHLFASSFGSMKLNNSDDGGWENQRAPYMEQIGGIYQIKKNVLNALEDIENEILFNVEHVAGNQVSSKLMSVVEMLGLVTKEEFRTIRSYLKDKKSSDEVIKLFMDAVTMTGTSQSVDFLRILIVDGDLDNFDVLSIVMTLGHYVTNPTVDILNNFFEILKAPRVAEQPFVRDNVLLNFANLLNKECIVKEEGTVHSDQFGQFCSSSSPEITNIYIPYIINCLKAATAAKDEAYRETLLHALGIIGHPSLIPHLLPIIKGQLFTDDLILRVMSIFSLRSVSKKHRDILLPVYTNILDDPKEHRNVKIAALSMVLKSQPSLAMMQKLALSSWKDTDEEFSRFIFFTIKSLHEQGLEKIRNDEDLKKVVQMAKIVFPLTKPFPGMMFYSSSNFIIEYLKNLYDGYESDTTFTFSEDGNFIFHKIVFLIDKLKLPALELIINLRGEKSLMKQVQDIAYSMQFNSTFNEDKFPIHPDWKTNIDDLKIKIRELVPFQGLLNMNILDNIYFKLGANQLYLDSLVAKLDNMIKSPLKAIQSGICNQKFNINYIKAFNALPTQMIQTSTFGLPIVTEIQMPQIISLKGHVRIYNCEPENPENLAGLPNLGMKLLAISPAVELVLNFNYIGEFYGYTGFIIPFTSEVATAAVTEHRSVNLPTMETKFDWLVNATTNSLSLKFRSLETNATAVDVFHYSIRPFTGIREVNNFTPRKLHVDNKLIHSKDCTKTGLRNIDNVLGLNLTLFTQSDSRLVNEEPFFDKFILPNALFLSPFLFSSSIKKGMPSSQFQEFSLVYSPKHSRTKEVVFDSSMVMGWAYRDVLNEYGNIMSKQRNINWTPSSKGLGWEFKDLDIGHYDDWWRKYREGGYQGSDDTTPLQKKMFHALQWELDDPAEHDWGLQNDTSKIDWKLNLPFIFWRRGVYFDCNVAFKDDQSAVHQNYSANILLSVGDQKNKFSPKPLDKGIWFVYYMKKWHMQFEWMPESDQQFHMCMKGRLQKPRHFAQWNPDEWLKNHFIGYMYQQKISYGRTCDENKADLWLIPHVSKKQKKVAKSMPEGAVCEADRKQIEIERAWNGSFTFHTNYLSVPECREQLRQAAIMDQLLVYFNFTNLHGDFRLYQKSLEDIARLYLLPYVNTDPITWLAHPLDDGLGRYRLRFRFDSKRNTVDAYIVTAKKEIGFSNYTVLENVTKEYLSYNAFFGNKVVYETLLMNVTKQIKVTEREEEKFIAKNLRMPKFLRGIYPLSPLKTQEMNFEQPIEAITGVPMFQTCRVDNRGHVETFKGQKYDYQLDDCWTLLASDCSPGLSGGIFAKVVAGQDMEIKVYHSQYVWNLNWHHVRWNGPDEVWSQNGRPRYIQDFNVTVWYSTDQNSTKNLFKYQYWCSSDDVCFLELPDFIVLHDGMGLEVRSKRYISEFHSCGLCGDTDKALNKQVRTASNCPYTSYHLAAASYKHTTINCTAIPDDMKLLMEKEELRCQCEETRDAQFREMQKQQENKLFDALP